MRHLLFLVALFSASVAIAQPLSAAEQQPAPTTMTQEQFIYGELVKKIDGIDKSTDEKVANTLKEIEVKFSAKADAIESQYTSLQWLINIASLISVLFIVIIVGISVLIGKTARETKKEAIDQAKQAFDTAIHEGVGEGKRISQLIKETKQLSESLEEIETQLKGYTILADTTKSASNFDPLVYYYHLNSLIDRIESASSDRDDKSSEKGKITDVRPNGSEITYYGFQDPQFRQYASVVFDQIIKSLQEDKEKGTPPRITPDDLYNIAANASKADMDFVSLRVLELASELTQKSRPEIESRLIRQRLAAGRVTIGQAIDQLSTVLKTTNSFTLHLVVSEAFNIGQHSQSPALVAQGLFTDLPEALRTISYTLTNRGQLLMLSGVKKDWGAGVELFREGLRQLADEAPLARWYSHSWRDIIKFLIRDARLLAAVQADLDTLFDRTREAQGGNLPEEAEVIERIAGRKIGTNIPEEKKTEEDRISTASTASTAC